MEPELDTERQIWVVVRVWPGGKKETIGAFLNQDAARVAAGRSACSENWIALESIPIKDWPPAEMIKTD